MASAGLAIAADSAIALGLAVARLAIHTLFALNEERGLRRNYGEAFIDYMKSTPRFLDIRRFLRARGELARVI